MGQMVVEVWSDVACPYCFIGKKKFEKALRQFPGNDKIKILWKSFQLSPDLKTDPAINMYEYLCESKGINVEEAKEMTYFAGEAARTADIELNFDKVIPANTLNAHILIHFAGQYNLQNEITDKLFRAHFSEGRNIDDKTVLKDLASESGLDITRLDKAFNDDNFTDKVREDIYEAGQMAIRSVPFFVFNRKYAVSGAQDPVVFLRTLEKSFAEWESEVAAEKAEIIQGPGCSAEKGCM